MGYSHYWTHRRRFTNAEWTEITSDMLKIICASGVPVEEDPFSAGTMLLNGVGADGYETFRVIQNRPLEYNERGWDFCKTAQKPYDVIVTAILCYLESHWPKHFSVGSDGDVDDWAPGLALARKALPEKGNILDIPFEVRWESQWVGGGVYGKDYSVLRHRSGPLCVTKGTEILGQFRPEDDEKVTSILQKANPTGWTKEGQREKQLDRAIRNLLTYPELVHDPVV